MLLCTCTYIFLPNFSTNIPKRHIAFRERERGEREMEKERERWREKEIGTKRTVNVSIIKLLSLIYKYTSLYSENCDCMKNGSRDWNIKDKILKWFGNVLGCHHNVDLFFSNQKLIVKIQIIQQTNEQLSHHFWLIVECLPKYQHSRRKFVLNMIIKHAQIMWCRSPHSYLLWVLDTLKALTVSGVTLARRCL